jgi:hypothetical protein
MTRDEAIYARYLQKIELLQRGFRLNRIGQDQYRIRMQHLSASHYKAQHKAGATDYPAQIGRYP